MVDPPAGHHGHEHHRVGFGAWAIGAAAGLSPGASRTTPSRWPPSATPPSPASTGSTPRPSTATATPRRSWPGRSRGTAGERPYVFTKCGLVWDDKTRWCRPSGSATPRACAARWRRRCAAGRRTDRPLPDALAGRRRHAHRGLLADAPGPKAEGKVRRRRPVQPRRRPARRGGGVGHVDSLQPPFSRSAATRAPPSFLVRRARHRRHRLQPDAGGPAQRRLHRERAASCPPTTGARGRPSSRASSCSATSRWRTRWADRRGATTRPWPRWQWPGVAWPGVTAAIVGARRPSQVDGWIDAARSS